MSNGISDTQNPQATIAHLRGLLQPLLDEPLRYHFGNRRRCLFCVVVVLRGEPGWDSGDGINFPHEPTCPVLQRDHILGR